MTYGTALIDGSGFAKAAYVKGKRALCHRFLQRVFSVYGENPGVRICVAWDPADNVSRRLEIFADYKLNRRAKVRDLEYLREVRNLAELLPLLGVDQAWSTGWEADDVLGTLARSTAVRPVLVLTRDADLLQLVRDDVHVLMKIHSRQVVYTPVKVQKERGISPEAITDWKALAGDAGDGVPGIPGVGAKTASKVLETYPSLVTDVLSGRVTEVLQLRGFPTRRKSVQRAVERVLADPEYLRTMRALVELHEVPVTFRRGRINLIRARREFLNSGLVNLRTRLGELEGVA